jgi:hypothetical protein
MRRQKLNIIIVVILLVISSSCQSLRIKGGRGDSRTGEINAGRFIAEMKSTNISAQAVSINRIVINYENDFERRRLRANARLDGKGNVLVSIRTFAGIEAARILITKDTVKVADRINRICYVGNTTVLASKYGFEYNFINLLFGDFVETNVTERRIACRDGKTEISDFGRGIRYRIDCSLFKIVEAVGNISEEGNQIRGEFTEFEVENGLIYPSKIIWNLGIDNTIIEMGMQNISRSDNDELRFNVGDSYRVKELK